MVAKGSIFFDVYIPNLHKVVGVLIIVPEAIVFKVLLSWNIIKFIGFT